MQVYMYGVEPNSAEFKYDVLYSFYSIVFLKS